MILGVTRESWINSLPLKTSDEYLKLVDNLIIVSDSNYAGNDPPWYFVHGNYEEVVALLKEISVCKAYSQKTLYSVNYSIVEITDGMTPQKLREEWINELHARCLV